MLNFNRIKSITEQKTIKTPNGLRTETKHLLN